MAGSKPVRRKAVFLVFSLWIFIFLAIFCLSLGFRTFITVRKTKLVLSRVRAQSLAISGVNIAKSILAQNDPASTYLGQSWGQEADQAIAFKSPAQSGSLQVVIFDEASRLNINTASRQLLQNIFEGRGVDDASAKIDYLLSYINTHAAANISDPQESVKNEPLAILEEITAVKDLTFDDYKKVSDLFTTFTVDGKINVNTASRELLESVIGDSAIKSAIFARRFGSNPGHFEDSELTQLLSSATGQAHQQAADLLKVLSDTFRIISTAEVGGVSKKITCVFKLDSGIIYWYEE